MNKSTGGAEFSDAVKQMREIESLVSWPALSWERLSELSGAPESEDPATIVEAAFLRLAATQQATAICPDTSEMYALASLRVYIAWLVSRLCIVKGQQSPNDMAKIGARLGLEGLPDGRS